MKKIIAVGQKNGDIVGNDDVAVQSAIDYLSYVGGGTVTVAEGTYLINTSVRLRPNVDLAGAPGKTVFYKCANVVSALAADGDANERRLTLVNPDGFEPGHTVIVRFAGQSQGFLETTALITAKEGDVVTIDCGLINDYCIKNNAVAERNFPVVAAYNSYNNRVSGITVDGNKANNSLIGGCRSAGIYFFESKDMVVENCTVKNYNGDGISYQVCNNVNVTDSAFYDNAGLGLHPGSGTTVTRVANCKVYGNGQDGVFVCWRVTGGVIEDCDVYNNARNGLSIGHKDTRNVVRNNRFYDNGHSGMLFREEIEPMGANFNTVENNIIADNGSEDYAKHSGGIGYVGIRVYGCTHGVEFIGNSVSYKTAPAGGAVGILVEKGAYDNVFNANTFMNCEKEIIKL